MPDTLLTLRPKPGIKRDGTRFDGDNYTDGQWTRFQRGLPRKILGYNNLCPFLNGISRGLHLFPTGTLNYVHSGWASGLDRFTINSAGAASAVISRTPSGFDDSPNNDWQLDVMYDAGGNASTLIAHAGQNLADIQSSIETPIYYGNTTLTTALQPITGSECSGGVTVIHPYLFYFSNNGRIGWSVPNQPTDLAGAGSGQAFVTETKIVRGLPLRGNQQGPAGLFWSLNSLTRASFVGTAAGVWAFDEQVGESSILSSNSVIQYDGIYYWCGVDRFLMYNGVVRELPNDMNLNWFFDGLNYDQRQKVFAFKSTRWGEIWWCYPRGAATECTHAIIYNVRENSWYDTVLPNGGRSAAFPSQVYRFPIMTGVNADSDGRHIAWQHNVGSNEINGSAVNAIQSYFETSDVTLTESDSQPGQDISLQVSTIEPDFVQTGDLRVSLKYRANARATIIETPLVSFPDVATTAAQQNVNFTVKGSARQVSVRFESNTRDGDFQMGRNLLHIKPADGRRTQ